MQIVVVKTKLGTIKRSIAFNPVNFISMTININPASTSYSGWDGPIKLVVNTSPASEELALYFDDWEKAETVFDRIRDQVGDFKHSFNA